MKCAAVALLLGPVLVAQVDAVRKFRTYHTAVTVGQDNGMLTSFSGFGSGGGVGSASMLSWCNAKGEAQATMPFQLVGGVQELAPGHMLLSGASVTNPPISWLVRVQLDPVSGIVLRESVSYPGHDFYDLAWDPSLPLLGILDKHTNVVLAMPFAGLANDPATPVLGPVSALFPIADSDQVPILRAKEPALFFENGAFGVVANPDYGAYTIALGATGWTATPPPQGIAANRWLADAGAGHVGPLSVQSTAPALGVDNSFVVEHLRLSQTVASGVLPSVGTWTAVPAPSAFFEYPGDEFRITGPLSSASSSFRPLLRYGAAGSEPGLAVGAARLVASQLYVGSTRAGFHVPVQMPGIPAGQPVANPVPTTAFLLLGFGFRGAGAPPDPVVGQGSNARLVYSVAMQIDHRQTTRDSGCGAVLTVPDDPGVEGLVMLSQWAFLGIQDPNHLVYSDIVGARIAGAPAPAAATRVANGSPAAGPGTEALRAARRQLLVDAWQRDRRALSPASAAAQRLRAQLPK